MEHFEKKFELASKDLKQIITLSFMFSQGNPVLQEQLLSAISVIVGSQNKDRVIDELHKIEKTFFVRDPEKMIPAHKFPHGTVPADLKMDQPKFILPLLETVDPADVYFDYIAAQIWKTDYGFLNRQYGRPNRKDNFKENTLQDPFFSFGVHYIEREMSSGNQYFDAVLDGVRDIPRKDIRYRLEVIAKYNETHPDTPLE
jgi:hypothetical protein